MTEVAVDMALADGAVEGAFEERSRRDRSGPWSSGSRSAQGGQCTHAGSAEDEELPGRPGGASRGERRDVEGVEVWDGVEVRKV